MGHAAVEAEVAGWLGTHAWSPSRSRDAGDYAAGDAASRGATAAHPPHAVLDVLPHLAVRVARRAQSLPGLVEAPRHVTVGVVDLLVTLPAPGGVGPEGALLRLRVGLRHGILLCQSLLPLSLSHSSRIQHLPPGGATGGLDLDLHVPGRGRGLGSEGATRDLLLLGLDPLLLLSGLVLSVAPIHDIHVVFQGLLRGFLRTFQVLHCHRAAGRVHLRRIRHLIVLSLRSRPVFMLLCLVVHAVHIQGVELGTQKRRVESRKQLHDAATLDFSILGQQVKQHGIAIAAGCRGEGVGVAVGVIVVLVDRLQRRGSRGRGRRRAEASSGPPCAVGRPRRARGLRGLGVAHEGAGAAEVLGGLDCVVDRAHQHVEEDRQREQVRAAGAFRVQVMPERSTDVLSLRVHLLQGRVRMDVSDRRAFRAPGPDAAELNQEGLQQGLLEEEL
mmetsp:Transcript_77920/g.252704  ORF Transcript_77920/g.252704 Transcript_77920/m.252704 type:complete len:443 (-) Transcript_77920:1404-2732(-)